MLSKTKKLTKGGDNIGRIVIMEFKAQDSTAFDDIEPDCWEGVKAQLERMKSLCKERDSLYEKQNDLKGQKQKIERTLER